MAGGGGDVRLPVVSQARLVPSLRRVAPPDRIGEVHKHGQKAVALQARMIRTPLYPVEQADVESALRWLDEQWGGAVYVPDELRNVAAVA